MTSSFLAIDFETADPKRDSACAVGAVLVRGTEIVERFASFIRPPRDEFWGPCIGKHGIRWVDVKNEQPFPSVWLQVEKLVRQADRIVAHNASFDRSVLRACCLANGISLPTQEWACTMKLARHRWNLPSAALPDVCTSLGIALDHHEAGSDAEACARILIADLRGMRPDSTRLTARPRTPSRPARPLHLHRSATVAPHAPSAMAIQRLSGICQGICADQRIVHEEFDLLLEWLQAHEELCHEYPVDLISLEVARILEDGSVTEQELDALRCVITECAGSLERFGT